LPGLFSGAARVGWVKWVGRGTANGALRVMRHTVQQEAMEQR